MGSAVSSSNNESKSSDNELFTDSLNYIETQRLELYKITKQKHECLSVIYKYVKNEIRIRNRYEKKEMVLYLDITKDETKKDIEILKVALKDLKNVSNILVLFEKCRTISQTIVSIKQSLNDTSEEIGKFIYTKEQCEYIINNVSNILLQIKDKIDQITVKNIDNIKQIIYPKN